MVKKLGVNGRKLEQRIDFKFFWPNDKNNFGLESSKMPLWKDNEDNLGLK
jgi:hypothetical protein